MEIKCTFLTNETQQENAQLGALSPNTSTDALPLPMAFQTMEVQLATGEITVVTGPNGVGKSALLGEVARSASAEDKAEIFFGSRLIQFESADVDQMGQDLESFQRQLPGNVTRYRHPWPERHLKSVVRRIINRQVQATNDKLRMIESGATLAEAAAAHPEPLQTMNGIFASAGIPIQIVLQEGTLRAQRDAAQYGIERLSDGERAALLVVGAVLIRPHESFILIDEPERHLNPAISGALLAALTRARTDLGYVFSTHDLHLIEWLRPDQIIHVRDSVLVSEQPEQRRFDLTIIEGNSPLPEELRYAILGSRRWLLLVEGEVTSEDQALYGHLYPEWHILARGGCDTVVSGVKTLRGNQDYHWLTVAGIIDRDGRDESERSALAAEKIFSLPVPTIENLFLRRVALEQMADAAHALHGGQTGPERMAALDGELEQLLVTSKDDILARRVVWEASRLLSSQKPSVRSVRQGQMTIAAIDLAPVQARLESEFEAARQSGDTDKMLSGIPVKNTQIPARVTNAIGFSSFDDYKRAMLKQIEAGSEAGIIIRDALRQEMPSLT